MSKLIFSVLFLAVLTSFACSSDETGKTANTEVVYVTPSQNISNTAILEKDYYRFNGTINENLSIVLDLNQENGSYVGSYYYTKHKMPIRFDGKKNENGEIVLQVYDKLGNIVEYGTGRINQNTFIGKWQNAEKTKTFPIYLTETLDRSVLFHIEKIIKGENFHNEYITIRQVPKDGDLTRSQKKILELQNLQISTNREAENLVKEIEKNLKDNPLEEDYYLNRNIEIVFNDFSIATIKTHYEKHEPMSSTYYIFDSYYSIDGQKGKEITLKSIFGKENLEVIKDKVLTKEVEVMYGGYPIPTFIIDKEGITIPFDSNPSGKAAGMAGDPEETTPEDIVFRWSEIEDLIKENSPVRRIFEN